VFRQAERSVFHRHPVQHGKPSLSLSLSLLQQQCGANGRTAEAVRPSRVRGRPPHAAEQHRTRPGARNVHCLFGESRMYVCLRAWVDAERKDVDAGMQGGNTEIVVTITNLKKDVQLPMVLAVVLAIRSDIQKKKKKKEKCSSCSASFAFLEGTRSDSSGGASGRTRAASRATPRAGEGGHNRVLRGEGPRALLLPLQHGSWPGTCRQPSTGLFASVCLAHVPQELTFRVDGAAVLPGTYSGPASRVYLYYTNGKILHFFPLHNRLMHSRVQEMV
jgi:hypothetical protein